jgi:hypothetical protein
MFPVVRFDVILGFRVPIEIVFFCAYIGVDNSTSALTGQAVLGFPKLCGKIDITLGVGSGFQAKVYMPAFLKPGRNQAQQLPELVHVKSDEPERARASIGAFPWAFTDLPRSPIAGFAEALFDIAVPSLFSVVNLKQFRDGADPPNAVYQAVVRSEFTLTNSSNWVAYPNAEITVTKSATFDIVGKLGLHTQSDGTLKPVKTIGMTTDMKLGDVTNLPV